MMVDSVVERLNFWGELVAHIAWPLFWQSSLLIAGMFVLDFFLRRRLRASVRHALWLIVLIKLLLPPSLALPSGMAWWLRPREVAPAKAPVASYIVTYGPIQATVPLPATTPVVIATSQIHLSRAAWFLFGTCGISLTLLLIMLARWRLLRQQLRKSESAPIWLQEMVHGTQRKAGCRRRVRLLLTDASISPALCGLLRPVIVLPTTLAQRLSLDQLRAVLLHELVHLRNGDVWVNCFQSLLQIVFWWHPLLWLANARIRKIREEVVDDWVRFALGTEADTYAPTLLKVARLALARPLATLGLVGILESRNALKQRVDRLVNFPAPRRAGLSILSGFAVLAFASVALPMGQAPPKIVKSVHSSNSNTVLADNEKVAESAKFGWNIQPLADNGWVQYDLASGIGTATNGAVVRHGGTTISADNITVNQQTGEVVANGSAKIQSGATSPVIESDRIEFDAATGTATATGHPVLRQGDQVVQDRMTLQKTLQAKGITYEAHHKQADNTTFDSQGSKVLVDGHYDSKAATGDAKDMQLAQVQPSLINPTRTIHTSSGRRAILNKLEAIRLDHVAFDNLPLSEVLNYLRDEAKKRDPEGKGINFILNPNTDLDGAAGPPAIDPATGLQIPPQQIEPADINGVAIRILPELNDVRMIDVLDAIIKVANPRIRYSLEDYGISFRLAGNATSVPLFTRVIKVDPNVFAQGLESVVGISVGNFQTGGQGGGGQQGNGSGVTVPRVQVAPNIGGQGGIGGGQGGGAQGGAGGISGVTRPTTAITPQSVRQFFVNAGVDLTPPKSIFFDNRTGALVVHAGLADLDIIEQAVGALSATAGQPPTARINNTPSNPVSPETNVAKLPVLGDLPVLGKAFTRTVEVATANSPNQTERATQLMLFQKQRERLEALYTQLNDLLTRYTEKHPSVQATRKQIEDLQEQLASANTGNGEKLITRIMKVEPATFFEWVKKTVGLGDSASAQEKMDAFRKILLNNGLQLAPPANIYYSEPSGSLFIRASTQEMEAIEQLIQPLNVAVAPAQINIKAKFVELSEADAKWAFAGLNYFPKSNPESNTNSTVGLRKVLSDPQFREILHELEQHDTVNLRSESSVTTVSGRQAQIQNVDMQSVVSLNRQAFTPPGVTSSNLLHATPTSSGPVLDIIPVVKSDGMTVSLEATATVTEFLGYDQPPKGDSTFVYVDGKAQSITPPLPHFRVRNLHNTANLYDGQTLMLGMPSDTMIMYDKEGKATTQPSDTRKELLVFLTATIIDPAGNPVHSGDPLLLVPDQK